MDGIYSRRQANRLAICSESFTLTRLANAVGEALECLRVSHEPTTLSEHEQLARQPVVLTPQSFHVEDPANVVDCALDVLCGGGTKRECDRINDVYICILVREQV